MNDDPERLSSEDLVTVLEETDDLDRRDFDALTAARHVRHAETTLRVVAQQNLPGDQRERLLDHVERTIDETLRFMRDGRDDSGSKTPRAGAGHSEPEPTEWDYEKVAEQTEAVAFVARTLAREDLSKEIRRALHYRLKVTLREELERLDPEP